MSRQLLMALAVATAAMLFSPMPHQSWAACRNKALAGTEAEIVEDVAKHLKPLGVDGVVSIGTIQTRDYFRLQGAKPRLYFVPESGKPTGVGVLLDEPATPADDDLQLTLAAFLLLKSSGMPEATIRAKLAASFAARTSDGQWIETFGSATAILTKSSGLKMVLIGQIDCS